MDVVERSMEQRLKKARLPKKWAEVGIVFQDQYSILLRDAVQFPDGSFGTYIRSASEAQGVVMLPRYQDHILVLRHFRHATRAWHIEIPRGFGILGVSAEESARQELKEEVDASIARIISLGVIHSNTGMSADATQLYYAEIASYGQPDRAEGIAEICAISISDMETMIRDGEITDAFAIAAYTRARLRGLLHIP